MSANLDLVRSILAAWERGDYASTEWAHPAIEYVVADGPSPGRWVGVAGMLEGWGDWANAWEEFHVEADEYRELDGEPVLVLDHYSGRGKTSGLELGQVRSRGAILLEIGHGKVTKLISYWDRERAFADLGLAPEAGAAGPD